MYIARKDHAKLPFHSEYWFFEMIGKQKCQNSDTKLNLCFYKFMSRTEIRIR